MKLLVISQYFYPESFRVADVCFKLEAMGHDVSVLTGLPNYPAGEIFEGYEWEKLSERAIYIPKLKVYQENLHGVNVLRCRLFPRKTGKKNLVQNYISFAFHASHAAKAMVNNSLYNFDRIIVFQYSPVTMALPGIILKKKLKSPLLLYCFDLWPESIVSAGLPNYGPFYHAVLKLSRWIYRKADTILISSKNFEKYFDEKLDIRGNIHYLPIYAEDMFSVMSKMEFKTAFKDMTSGRENQFEKTTDLVFAGNIGEMQSLETIIKAADLIRSRKDIHFHIVGDGSALERSMKLTKDLTLENITFHGRHPLAEMPCYYELADAFLVTLKKDPFISYTLPGKVQSYMAAGKPILAAIDGETSDTIRAAGCGLCCGAEDHQALAQIILQFAGDKENRRKYGDNSKAYYGVHFSEESFFQTFSNYLDPA